MKSHKNEEIKKKTAYKDGANYEKVMKAYLQSSLAGTGLGTDAKSGTKLKSSIESASKMLLSHLKNDTYWDGKIEDTPALTAQYIMYMHYMDMVDLEKQRKCVNYLFNIQNPNGAWRIYAGDEGNLSYSIHCYFGLKLAGVDINHPKMVKAREYILANGGLDKGNVETRFLLALFGKSSWKRAVPVPLHIVMLGKWFPVSMWNMAYWIRITLVSMGILYHLKPVRNPGSFCDLDELWIDIKVREKYTCPRPIKFFSKANVFYQASKAAKLLVKILPKKRILKKALKWVLEHQDSSGDWGGIYPPMMYSSFMLKEMGYKNNDPVVVKAKEAIERFQHHEGDEIMQSSCTSPIWDTAWAIIALLNAGFDKEDPAIKASVDWLYSKQIWIEGDWKVHAPDAKPGMWAFQHYNDYYPDTDDTAVVLMALKHTFAGEDGERSRAYKAGCDWLYNMQNNDGGWAAFERNIDSKLLPMIPLNDLDNYVDPSTPELTGRVLELYGRLGFSTSEPFIAKAVESLKTQQEEHGSWHGKWGVHYIYGAFGVLRGLGAIGYDMKEPWVRKCVDWFYSIQNEDGGWGESCKAYEEEKFFGKGKSVASQSAWAILSLLAAGEKDDPRVKKGIDWLISNQKPNGEWDEDTFTGTGFPKAFYLRYDLYRIYFPLLALAEYENYENTIWCTNK
jgi:squalene-hopene/tetraprenyl-beta-curcumene cyclase